MSLALDYLLLLYATTFCLYISRWQHIIIHTESGPSLTLKECKLENAYSIGMLEARFFAVRTFIPSLCSSFLAICALALSSLCMVSSHVSTALFWPFVLYPSLVYARFHQRVSTALFSAICALAFSSLCTVSFTRLFFSLFVLSPSLVYAQFHPESLYSSFFGHLCFILL